MNDKLHVSVANPRKKIPDSRNKGLGGPQTRSEQFGEEKMFLLLLGFEPQPLHPQCSHYTNCSIPSPL